MNSELKASDNVTRQEQDSSSTTITSKQKELSPESIEQPIKGGSQSSVSTSLGDIVGGSSTRRYLNDRVTPVLLEGMRRIAIEKPNDPLRVLGEYLIAESEKRK